MSIKFDRIIAFLNTGLGLWLLSSVALGGISFFYGQMNSYLIEHNRKMAQIERLHIEIFSRLMQYAGHCGDITENESFDRLKPNSDYSDATISLVKPPSALKDSKCPIYAAFPEYNDRPMVSILVEIALLLDPNQREHFEPNFEVFTALTPERIRRSSPAELKDEIETMFFRSEYWKKFF